MNATALKVPKIMYIFQLMDHSRGGTAKAKMQFLTDVSTYRERSLGYSSYHVQLVAVAIETAFARTLAGKISDG